MGLSLGLGLNATRAVGGSSGPILTVLPVTPTARWHPGFSTVTESGGRVVSATDLMGLADVTEGAPGNGPRAMTDAMGREFWRFDESEFLNVAGALETNNRDVSVFFVGRVNRVAAACPIFAGGNVALGTQLSGSGILDVAQASNSAPFLRCTARAGSLDATNAPWMVAGAQMQVLAATSRTTALGAISLFINDKKASVAQNTISRPALTGGEIGRNPVSTSQLGGFDLYELIVYAGAVSDTVAEEINAALMTTYSILPVENQLILEGDSITQGTGLVTAGLSCAAVMTKPGASLIPDTWRVINMGKSGNQVPDLVTKRDAVNGWASMNVPGGQNVVAFEIGRNDFGAGGLTAAQHYTNVVAYLNTTTTGVLQRGWTVRAMANIATSGSIQAEVEAYRALIRDTQFLTDTLTNTGQTYDGLLSTVDTDLIEDGGQTIFFDATDAADTTYYAGDSTHPNILGAELRVNGGDDPSKAIAAGLT